MSSHATSDVRLSLKQGTKLCRSALRVALRISLRNCTKKLSGSSKRNLVFAMRAFWTLLIAPRPAVSKQAARHPREAHLHTLCPLLSDGERWIPYVLKPRASPLTVFELPALRSFTLGLLPGKRWTASCLPTIALRRMVALCGHALVEFENH